LDEFDKEDFNEEDLRHEKKKKINLNFFYIFFLFFFFLEIKGLR
jgi:hypothetical protein